MKVAYLTNQYPHVRHTFIRREVAAVEQHGIAVERFSIRASAEALVDPADRAERERTRVLLDAGPAGLLGSLLAVLASRPLRWLRAFRLACRLGRRSDRGVLRHWAYLAEACALVRRLRRDGVGHVHAHFATNSAAVALLAKALGGPDYSLTVHGSEEWDDPVGLSLKEKYEGAAFVAAVSEYGRGQVLRWCSHPHWPKVHVVRCGVDALFLAEGPQAVPDAPRLVAVGALVEEKGQLLLLQALKRLLGAGRAFEAVLAGDGPLRPVLEEEARRLGLQGRVRITGWLSNEAVKKQLLEARALVLPSLAENLPVVVMEALALGRPVVCSRLAGIPELVEPDVCGWLVPPGSVDALADALARVLDAPAERLTQMGKVGAARVAAWHDSEKEAVKLAALFAAADRRPG
jgi:glycosyltransferase involved in cell wall biosynthesis